MENIRPSVCITTRCHFYAGGKLALSPDLIFSADSRRLLCHSLLSPWLFLCNQIPQCPLHNDARFNISNFVGAVESFLCNFAFPLDIFLPRTVCLPLRLWSCNGSGCIMAHGGLGQKTTVTHIEGRSWRRPWSSHTHTCTHIYWVEFVRLHTPKTRRCVSGPGLQAAGLPDCSRWCTFSVYKKTVSVGSKEEVLTSISAWNTADQNHSVAAGMVLLHWYCLFWYTFQ